jgi:cobalt-zinc-cadmium efflux system outer membrane protein
MKIFVWWLGFALFLTACSSQSTSETPPIVDAQSSGKPGNRPKAYSVPAHAGPSAMAALAVRHNPKLQALRYRMQRLAEKVPQEEALPDPIAKISLGSLPETAAGRVEAVGGVSQKIPFPGKRKAMSSAAAQEAMAVRAEAKAFELKLTEQVYSAWWDYYLSSVNIRISSESKDLLKAVEETVEAQVAANQGQQADQLRVANEITKLDRDIAQAGQVGKTAKARLNALLNRPTGSALPKVSERMIESPGDLESLIQRASRSHPEVVSAAHRVEAFKYRLQRAKLEKYPDLTLGINGAAVSSGGLAPSANGEDQIFGTLGFNLPLWQKPRLAMIREAKAGIAETQALLTSTQADLRYRIEDSYFRAKTAKEVAQLFQNRLIPDSKQAYEVMLTSYAAGERSFTDLIETWRQWLTYQLQYAQNRAQLGKAIATLRSAAGRL